MLEIAARLIGGLCRRGQLRFEGNLTREEVTLEELVILHATGEMPESLVATPPASGVMMIPVPGAGVYESVSGVESALIIPEGIDDVVITAKQGQKLTPLPEGASYFGFVFASGADPVAVEEATAPCALAAEI